MFSVCVRDHVMIAHSLAGDVFGPAQNLHGATYVVDLCFFRQALDDNDIVVDIGLASESLKRTLAQINYRNLDELNDFKTVRSTTEQVAHWIFCRLARAIGDGELGPAARGIDRLKVTLHESHVASASYEADIASA